MNPLIGFIRGRAQHYAAYHLWVEGIKHIRGFEMKCVRKDIELAATLYRLERREFYIREAMKKTWGTHRAN